MSNSYSVKRKQTPETKEDLEKLSKQDLIDLVIRLQAHNVQLKNILTKKCPDEGKCDFKSNAPADKEKTNIQKKCNFSNKRHVLLKFFYLGWDYNGFVTQEHTDKTIEDEIFCALKKTCLIPDRQSSNYHRCGRTDKGVSAAGQIISLDIKSKFSNANAKIIDDSQELEYCKMLNRVLPDEIKCISWCAVPDDYSARFNCVSRSYKYYFVKGQLNIKAMVEACSYLIGEHDFRNMCKMDVGNGVTKFVKHILSASIDRCSNGFNDNELYDIYVMQIAGTGFLWHQIRCIMGVLFLIGENKESPDIIKQLFDIERHPRKPQYSPAHSIPLMFHDCMFDIEPKWNYDLEELKYVYLSIQKLWAINQIKATQVRGLISDLEKLGLHCPNVHCSGLECYSHTVVYKPLLERQTCESLESRIQHFVKKQRIEKQEEKS